MTGPTVQIPRDTVERIVIALDAAEWNSADPTSAPARDLRSALVDLLTDAAEGARWEPFRPALDAFRWTGQNNPALGSAADQRAMTAVAGFANLGLDLRDPTVLRPAIAALCIVEADARDCPNLLHVRVHLGRIAHAFATLARAEVVG